MSETVTLADVERLCWRLSGWTVEQRDVDRLLATVTAYAAQATGTPETVPAPEEPVPVQDAVPEAPQSATEMSAGGETGQETTEGATGPQTGVQRLHITGTLTLVCAGHRAQEPEDGRKTCTKCGAHKPLERFCRAVKGKPRRRSVCRDCDNRRKREASKKGAQY